MHRQKLVNGDEAYLSLIVEPLRVSASYRPKFGLGKAGLELDDFTKLYTSDQFYSWVGFDSPLVYTAHKAAGGMTSIYRQLGTGCERLFQRLLQDMFGLTEEQANWQYTVPVSGGRTRTLKLDGRIDLLNLPEGDAMERVSEWLEGFRRKLDVQSDIRGAVFEVRQGYKSRDSKRQNADLANASNAYTQRYLPVLTVMSLQLDNDLRTRYEGSKWAVLSGITNSNDIYTSVYAFCREVVGYDLAAFFERNSEAIRSEVLAVINSLLEPT